MYLGNLNYNVKDENVHEFFKDCGTITNIRWLTHKDTGKFKGAGYVEFTETTEVDTAVKKNACIFMGRPLRIDFAESRNDSNKWRAGKREKSREERGEVKVKVQLNILKNIYTFKAKMDLNSCSMIM